MLAYVIMFVVMFAIKCVTLTFVKNKESTVVSTFLSGTNQIFLNTIVWFLRLTAMFQFYLLVVDNNLTVIPIIIGFILPNVLFWFKGIKSSLSDLLVRWLKSFIGHKYRTCPFCHESHLFFRYTEDLEDSALLDRRKLSEKKRCLKTLDRMLANLSQDNTLGAFKLISLLGEVASEFTDAENEVSEC